MLWVSVEEDWNLGPNGTRLMSVAAFARHESQSPKETVAFSLTVRCGKSISMMIRNPKSLTTTPTIPHLTAAITIFLCLALLRKSYPVSNPEVDFMTC